MPALAGPPECTINLEQRARNELRHKPWNN